MKKHFQLIPATLLLLFFGCQSVKTIPPSSNEFRESSSLPSLPFLPTQEENSEFVSESEQSPPDCWNMDNVDLSNVDKTRKLISFTFDDAPSRTLENILAVYASFNEQNSTCKASATVFFNGALFDNQNIHLLHAAYALGFELGNHTQTHKNLTTLTSEQIHSEIQATDKLLQKVDGRERHLLRAPFGRVNEQVKALAEVPIIDWTIDTLDWTGVSEETIYRTVFDNRFSGAIVLMHDGYENTVSALKRLLPDLAADGYQVVSVSKMAKAHGCILRRGNVYIRARKQKN